MRHCSRTQQSLSETHLNIFLRSFFKQVLGLYSDLESADIVSSKVIARSSTDVAM